LDTKLRLSAHFWSVRCGQVTYALTQSSIDEERALNLVRFVKNLGILFGASVNTLQKKFDVLNGGCTEILFLMNNKQLSYPYLYVLDLLTES
jgi:hypothetical protein